MFEKNRLFRLALSVSGSEANRVGDLDEGSLFAECKVLCPLRLASQRKQAVVFIHAAGIALFLFQHVALGVQQSDDYIPRCCLGQMRVLNRDGNFASRFRTGQGTGNDSVCSGAGGQVFRLYSGIVVAGYWLCLGIAVFVQDLGFDVDLSDRCPEAR